MTKTEKPRVDVQAEITAKIVAAIETAGNRPHEWPWRRASAEPRNAATKKSYRGANWLALKIAITNGASPFFATFKQWQSLGATIRKGSKGTLIAFWGDMFVDEETGKRCDPDDQNAKRIVFAKPSYVFSANQVEGWEPPSLQSVSETDRIEAAERFFAATGAVYREGTGAFYSPQSDTITLPPRASFLATSDGSSAAQNFYGVKAHETVHWTGHESRCNRDFTGRFGSESYAFEELVAELGAAMLCAELGIVAEPTSHNVNYVEQWLRILKADKKAIFTAASKAQQAVEFLAGLQNSSAGETEFLEAA